YIHSKNQHHPQTNHPASPTKHEEHQKIIHSSTHHETADKKSSNIPNLTSKIDLADNSEIKDDTDKKMYESLNYNLTDNSETINPFPERFSEEIESLKKKIEKYEGKEQNPDDEDEMSEQTGHVSNNVKEKHNQDIAKEEPSHKEEQRESIIGIKTYQKNVKGDILEEYSIKLDGASADIKIIKGEVGTTYTLSTPKISIATNALLNDLREELIAITSVSMQELIDPKAFISLKAKFKEEAIKLLTKKIPTISKETSSLLVGTLIQEMLGIGKIEYLINDPNLEEIVIVSAKEPLRVYSKKYGWLITNILLEKEETTINYANIIARRVGRQITTLNPLLDAHLVTGDRVNAVLYPINTKGNTIVIRKFARDPYTIIDLINNKTCDLESAALLWLAVEYEMNIIISGGTASGKTVLLNACMPFIPPNQRIISIEDTKELILPEFLYWTPLVTRLANAEGKGAVTMIDLLINSLRMRPDRIILGEMRRREEAMVLFEAMHTGHSVYATLHADSAAETISRLTHPPLDIPPNLLGTINLNVVMFRDRRRGIRRVLQIAEIEVEGDSAKANTLYRWSAETDSLVKHSKSSKFFEDISRHTSMSENEINKELQIKKKIILWLIKHNVRKLEDLGMAINLYYQNKELLLKKIAKNDINFVLNYGK
ncbi:MAG: ATPase, T2SS/T4P/T4SS family, partial [Nanoarchaeota archaeon]